MNTTTMTAAGIARSCGLACARQSLLRLMVPGTARQASLEPLRWRLRLRGQRLQLPNLRLSDPALRPEPSVQHDGVAGGRRDRRVGDCRDRDRGDASAEPLGDRSPATPPVRPVGPRGEAGWVLVSVACCPAGLLPVGSGRRGMGHPGSSPVR